MRIRPARLGVVHGDARAEIGREPQFAIAAAAATTLDVLWLIELFGQDGSARASADDENIRQRLPAIALDGLRASGAGPLPGRPPSAPQSEARWQAPEPS